MARTVFLLAAMIVAGSAGFAAADTMACTDRNAAIRHLGGKFSEAPVAMGLTNTGEVLEVLTSDAGRSWTMLITMPNGTTCLVVAGEAWKTIPSVAAVDEGY